VSLPPTPQQTAGPYISLGLAPLSRPELVPEGAVGALVIRGRVLDGAGAGVPDGAVEIWQRPPAGTAAADWPGFGRCLTDPEGEFWFRTARPVAGSGDAPHLELLVFARGLTRPVRTRLYLPDEAEANAADTVLAGVPEDRRPTLVARAVGGQLLFDVRLQGDGETVFFG
jgi:protocatechuate 3,4-dioxygenase alpha subunit